MAWQPLPRQALAGAKMTSRRQSRFGDIAAAFMLLSRIPVRYQFAKDSPPDFIRSLWAFGGGRDVDDKMRIMHDSQIGSYGVLALCLSTIIRISLFASIATLDLSNLALIGLVAAIAAAARWQILIALWAFPIAAGAKLAKVTGRPSVTAIFAAAFLWVMPMAYFAMPLAAVIAGSAALLACLGLGRLAMRQIHGISGDVMGAMIILGEIMLAAGLFITLNTPLDIGFFG